MDTGDAERDARVSTVSSATSDENDLLTLAVPPELPVGEALERVEEAHADAEYLHADESSKARREVLGRVRHVLHGVEETPEHGLVVYAGEVDGEAREFVFDDLPAPVPEWRLDWSNGFDTAPLDAATGPTETYGLLVVERGGAALGRLAGGRVEVVETVDSDVMGKTRAGGQSADRFERDRERQKHEFFEEVADEAARAFLDGDAGEPAADGAARAGDGGPSGGGGVDGLLLGGTTVTVDEFRSGDYLDHRLRDRLVGGTFAVEYASGQGLRQLARKGRDAVDDAGAAREREVLDRFFDGLREDDAVVYGRERTKEALSYGAVDTLLVSAALPVEDARDLRDRADEEGGEVVVVPTDRGRGARFEEAFGGVGALLRFPVE